MPGLSAYCAPPGRSQAELDAVIADHMEAMHECVPGSQNALVIESDYGSALFRAYELTRNRDYLDSSVGPIRHAAEQTPAGHSRKSERLSNLVSVLVALFECDGDPATLDEAIRTGREAVAAASPHHAAYATCLFGLAYGLFRRGELRGTLLDFDEAAVLSGQVVEATPPGHTYRAMRLTLHAQALCYLPSAPKLENAAAGLARAASLLRHDDPDRAVIESNHAAILEALASLPGGGAPMAVSRAAEAVRLARKAVDATRPEHSEYSNRLLNLTIASATLARLLGDAAVLDDPIMRCRAVKAPEPADVSSTLLAAGLAHALAVRYDLTGDPEDASAAIEAYQLAAGDARLAVFRRLHVAQAGAVLAARCGETAVSLSLYALAVGLLDLAAWRGMGGGTRSGCSPGTRGSLPTPRPWRSPPGSRKQPWSSSSGGAESCWTATSMTARSLRCCARRTRIWPVNSKISGTIWTASSCRTWALTISSSPTARRARKARLTSAASSRAELEGLISEIRTRPGCAGLFGPPCLRRAAGGRRAALGRDHQRQRVPLRCDHRDLRRGGGRPVAVPVQAGRRGRRRVLP